MQVNLHDSQERARRAAFRLQHIEKKRAKARTTNASTQKLSFAFSLSIWQFANHEG
jgi:hypothetical protein